jgi:dipeptidyl aminopeptidase/acylaminoacyl peptidase
MMHAAIGLIGLSTLPVLVHGAEGSRRTVSLADLQSLSFPDVTMSLSPDGKQLAFAISNESVWIVATEPGSPARRIARGFLPMWSPAADRVAFYSDTSGSIQLWVYRTKSADAVQITRIPDGIDPDPATRIVGWVHDAFRYTWLEDGSRIVFASRVPIGETRAVEQEPISGRPPGSPLVLTRDTPADWTLSGIFARPRLSTGTLESRDGHSITAKHNDTPGAVLTSQLFVADTDTHQVHQLTHERRSFFNPHWSKEPHHLFASAAREPGGVFGAGAIDIVLIDARDGTAVAVTNGPGVRSRPTPSPDGRLVSYLGSETFTGRPDVYVVDEHGSGERNVTRALDRLVEDFAWSPDGRSILVTYQDGLTHAISRVDLATGQIGTLAKYSDGGAPVDISALSASQSGAIAWHQQDPSHPSVIRFAATISSSSVELLDLEPRVGSWPLGKAEIVRWKNRRGDEREGTLLKPPDFVAGRRYPLIVDVYPLAGGANWWSPMSGNQSWASQGYLVFRPSPRAPHVWMNAWKSQAENLAAKGPDGWSVTRDDVLSGVDELVERAIVDPSRIGLYGFSNGGSVVNELITVTDRFACAVSVAGALSDWIRPTLLTTDYQPLMAELAGVALRANPQAYVALSPVFHIGQVRTPVLLADGDDDGDFLLDTIEMFNGLRSAGDEVTLLRYPAQGHGFTGMALQDFWTREMAFFQTYLKTLAERQVRRGRPYPAAP